VEIRPVTPDLAEELELEEPAGVLVSRVYPGSPADKAGLERRDVIVEFDGTPISTLEELPQAVADTPVGKTVLVRVMRDGKREKIRVEIGEMETPELADTAAANPSPESFGLRTQTLTKELAERLGIEEDHGVVIAEVEPDSPAEEAGLRRGDVIVEVDKKEVEDTAELKELLQKADDRALVAVRRGRSSLYVVLKRE
jgi:serine protease Do